MEEFDPKHPGSFHAAANEISNHQTNRNQKKRRRGQPAVNIDLVELEKLASIQCTDEEIAAFFNVDRRTITRKKKQAEFRQAIERGKAKGRISVRRLIFQQAQQGSLAAAIFLAKNFLGYRDLRVAEADGQAAETDAQRKLRWKEALRKIRMFYGLNPDPPERGPAPDATVIAPKDSNESASSDQQQSSTDRAQSPKVDSGLIQTTTHIQ